MTAHGDDTYRYEDIRLNFSSNVYNHFDHSHLFRYLTEQMVCVASYPEPTPTALEQKLAELLSIDASNVIVTNGATEAIYLIAQSHRGARSTILQPTFAEYAEACRINQHTVRDVTELSVDPSQLFWLCNPNNPTGRALPKEEVAALFSQHPDTLFVLDQSYAPYYDGKVFTAQETVGIGNVILLHSMTKEYGIPGLRLGYITGSSTHLDRIRQMRMPWSVNSLAIKAGEYLLSHSDEYILPKALLTSERKRVEQALLATNRISTAPSDTHILLCRLHNGTAADLKDRLARNHGILIRDASNFHGLTPQHFRIAVQLPEENNILIDSIKATVEQSIGTDTPGQTL